MLSLRPHARRALERLTAIGVFSILAIVGPAPVTIHTGFIEQARDVVAAGHHRLRALVAHARYDAVHVGGVSFSFMIVVELLGTLVVIAVIICWAERLARNRAHARTGQIRPPGRDTAMMRSPMTDPMSWWPARHRHRLHHRRCDQPLRETPGRRRHPRFGGRGRRRRSRPGHRRDR